MRYWIVAGTRSVGFSEPVTLIVTLAATARRNCLESTRAWHRIASKKVLLFHRLQGNLPLRMYCADLLRAFVNAPELSAVGSAQERAAFIALHVEGRTVRETAEALGVSKSQVPNLSSLFQTKLVAKVRELRKTGTADSPEYRAACSELYSRLMEIQGSSDPDTWGGYWGGHKIGNYDTRRVSREDWAEVTGRPLRDPDDWN